MTLPAPTEDRLRAAGLRVTQPRVTVLGLLESGGHFTADDVSAATHRRVSVQGVYDVLDALVGAGLARRVEPAGSPMRYEARVGDNHHHVVCRRCGAVADVDCAVGAAPCLEPSAHDGFLLDEAEVVFWGTCPACQPVSTQDKRAERPRAGGPSSQPTYRAETLSPIRRSSRRSGSRT